MAEAALAAAVDDARSRGSALALRHRLALPELRDHAPRAACPRRPRPRHARLSRASAMAGGWRSASAHVVLAAALDRGRGPRRGRAADRAGRSARPRGRRRSRLAHLARARAAAPLTAAARTRRWPTSSPAARSSWRGRRAQPGRAALALRGGAGARRCSGDRDRGAAAGRGGARRSPRTSALRARSAARCGRSARSRAESASVELLEAAVACLEQLARPRWSAPGRWWTSAARCAGRAGRATRASRCAAGSTSPSAAGPASWRERAMREVTAAGRPPAAHRAPRPRGAHPARAPDGRPRRRGHVEPRDRGRAVRDREDRGVAPEAHLRQARDLARGASWRRRSGARYPAGTD